jgi:hypothetical protein
MAEGHFKLPPPPRQPTFKIEKLNPLAMPKNVSLTCELTGRPALVQLVTPHITLNFASREAAMQSWEGILCKIAHIMGTLLAPSTSVGSELERADHARDVAACQVALVALCNDEAARHTVQGHFDLAVPAATYSLRFATAAHGEGKLQLVPAYLYLAEAYLGSTQVCGLVLFSPFVPRNSFRPIAPAVTALTRPCCHAVQESGGVPDAGQLGATQDVGRVQRAALAAPPQLWQVVRLAGPLRRGAQAALR